MILVYHLLQAYTRGFFMNNEDTLIFSHSNAKRANVLSAQTPLHQHHRMLCFFHMTTGGIDASLPRTWPSRFGSSDHVLDSLLAGLDPRRPVGDHGCP
ncbi:hypothetical protein PENARI_c255G04726 [Penicillium arizonense]|uniref:Uncharacterized protein n=1 Tax=Penicillium arizonense TaxID=1835702 RepID=A0A1F5L0C9_PENAI|nr:hypothetical protein PENARI_c255G04726 [Penicillium arizonense]OGE46450.1 hypothetical protein PENARI_c255G04726 [Penicillium arizonense]